MKRKLNNINIRPSPLIEEWLVKPRILSKALRRAVNSIQVKVLDQRFVKALDDEYAVLNMQENELPFVRQVLLMGDNELPLTYGRVVIPPRTYQANLQAFEKLGERPIGETLLYNNPDVTRSEFAYSAYIAGYPIWDFIYQHLKDMPPQTLWARRSVFYIKENPLLITEVFLPFLPPYVAEDIDA